ncbi:MAG: hypothetical protein A2Y67_00295 [Candidatus Buchananbacteria bacterium RBG_13_39_9]|uniref:Uncharacterized protein n=1 Tax=Candidatus Buchananbacteria bacterium RBG_13_39_9 TaxID=1797531 RepID=A0A1G1XR78_9BACT|nr:MAG: hypothetical protein A2Y67_00295 [Candidatus Buchananbacteria bacterium RBG_13_39_9]
MINVCTCCLRINPLGSKRCHYCQGKCQAMKSLAYGQFRTGREGKNNEKKEGGNDQEEFCELQIFEDCYRQRDETELIIARP